MRRRVSRVGTPGRCRPGRGGWSTAGSVAGGEQHHVDRFRRAAPPPRTSRDPPAFARTRRAGVPREQRRKRSRRVARASVATGRRCHGHCDRRRRAVHDNRAHSQPRKLCGLYANCAAHILGSIADGAPVRGLPRRMPVSASGAAHGARSAGSGSSLRRKRPGAVPHARENARENAYSEV